MLRRPHLTRVATIEEYKDWLFDLVDCNGVSDDYSLLLGELFDTPFEWRVPNDDNRAYEGMDLREQFCRDLRIEYIPEHYPKNCSMLELIIALALRCESMGEDDLDYKNWFWELLTNCNLIDYSDDNYYVDGENSTEIIEKIINRTYTRKGLGGLFPLKTSRRDQRKIELWYQMSAYLSEKYNYYD